VKSLDRACDSEGVWEGLDTKNGISHDAALNHLGHRFSNSEACPQPTPPRGTLLVPGGGGEAQVNCMKDIFILNEIWAQGKIHI
jgi:hypothetical protein